MLRKARTIRMKQAGGSFAIIASRYNALYVDSMVRAATAELKKSGARTIRIIRVPGAFEIPVVAARLARQSSESQAPGTRSSPKSRVSAILCLGVIFQGQTSHAQHIGWGVTHALAQIQVRYGVPVIHAVFTFENKDHARVRCLEKRHNRGAEAALTAVEMANVCRSL